MCKHIQSIRTYRIDAIQTGATVIMSVPVKLCSIRLVPGVASISMIVLSNVPLICPLSISALLMVTTMTMKGKKTIMHLSLESQNNLKAKCSNSPGNQLLPSKSYGLSMLPHAAAIVVAGTRPMSFKTLGGS